MKINKITKTLKKSDSSGLFHDTRGDVKKLAIFGNILKDKVNELVDEVNKMKEELDKKEE